MAAKSDKGVMATEATLDPSEKKRLGNVAASRPVTGSPESSTI